MMLAPIRRTTKLRPGPPRQTGRDAPITTAHVGGPHARRAARVAAWRATACAALVSLGASSAVRAEDVLWRFDRTERIGGFKTTAEGHPRVIPTDQGQAVQFDGKGDRLHIDGRPLVGARAFTIECLFRPEGGGEEQRFLHIAETDPVTGADVRFSGKHDSNPRIMFEIRVKDGYWWPDAMMESRAGWRALIFPEKRFPIGPWYSVQQTYDGKTFRLYVDGVLQGQAEMGWTPHGPGRVSVGARMNRVDFFKGSVARMRFVDRALSVEDLLAMRPAAHATLGETRPRGTGRAVRRAPWPWQAPGPSARSMDAQFSKGLRPTTQPKPVLLTVSLAGGGQVGSSSAFDLSQRTAAVHSADVGADSGARRLVETACTKCHAIGMVTMQRKTRAEWQATVDKMMSAGAPISDDQADQIIDYLSKSYPR